MIISVQFKGKGKSTYGGTLFADTEIVGRVQTGGVDEDLLRPREARSAHFQSVTPFQKKLSCPVAVTVSGSVSGSFT